MNDFKVALKSKIEGLKAEIKTYEDQEKEIKDKLTNLREVHRSCETLLKYESGNGVSDTQNKIQGFCPNGKLTDVVFEILSISKKPLHTKILVEMLEKRGRKLEAKKPFESLAANLSKDSRFINIGKNTFKLNEQSTKTKAPLLESEA